MKFDPKYPARTKGGETVAFLTTESRDPKFPYIGYVGDEDTLTKWDKDGAPQYGSTYDNGSLENIPFEGVVYIAIYSDGKRTGTYTHLIPRGIPNVSEMHLPLVSVLRLPYSVMPGVQDHITTLLAEAEALKEEMAALPTLGGIVDEFADIKPPKPPEGPSPIHDPWGLGKMP
jgi:hypothetical protein